VNYTCLLIQEFDSKSNSVKDVEICFLSNDSILENYSTPPSSLLAGYVLFVLKLLFGLCETDCYIHPQIKEIIQKLSEKFSIPKETFKTVPLQKKILKNQILLAFENNFDQFTPEETLIEFPKKFKNEKNLKPFNYEEYYVRYLEPTQEYHFQFTFFLKTLSSQLEIKQAFLFSIFKKIETLVLDGKLEFSKHRDNSFVK
jgi:hypothetical protein